MRLLIPITDALVKLRAQVVFRCNISNASTLALQDAEPLFDVIHPRAMHRGEVHDKSRMLGEPSGDFFSMMRTDMIADEMNRPNVRGHLLV
jgi:hypothetical protein